jgi:DHA1 family bicyclomycin/chloramphenicol resistance-like MFS transporter
VHADWHAIFWLLVAWALLLWRWPTGAGCPRPCTPTASPSRCGNLLRGYWQLLAPARASWLLVLASGVPFNGMFLYVLSAPAWLGEHLQLAPTQFFWFFLSHRRHHGRRLAQRAAGRPHAPARRSARLRDHAGHSLVNVVAQRCWRRMPPGRCRRWRCSPSAGR